MLGCPQDKEPIWAPCYDNQYNHSQTVLPEDEWAHLTVGEKTGMV